MKKLLVFAVAALAASAAVPAIAGDCCGSSSVKSQDGFSCSNPCPLAQQANTRRSMGRESLALSNALRASYAASVQRNLGRI
jgi:hypothetical protein